MYKSIPAALLLACAVKTQRATGSSLALPGLTDFFVCGSSIDALNGHYVLSDELQSDEQTPVFVREDDKTEDTDEQEQHDFRLYRHNGFWLLADVAEWPPKTHFRCDPTKYNPSVGIDTVTACGMNLPAPPLYGYSAVDAKYSFDHLGLYQTDCKVLLSTTPTPRVEL